MRLIMGSLSQMWAKKNHRRPNTVNRKPKDLIKPVMVKEVNSKLSSPKTSLWIHTTPHLTLKHAYTCFRLGEPWGYLESRPRQAWQSHATRLSLKLLEQLSSTLWCRRDSNPGPLGWKSKKSDRYATEPKIAYYIVHVFTYWWKKVKRPK